MTSLSKYNMLFFGFFCYACSTSRDVMIGVVVVSLILPSRVHIVNESDQLL